MKTALTIADSDCSGGAGIQTDIKTMTANDLYAISTLTSNLPQGFPLSESAAFDLRSEYAGEVR